MEANLEGANLAGANLGVADWASNSTLGRTDLQKANLQKAILCDAILTEAYLVEADLSRADLSRAKLEKADLRNATLIETNLRSVHGSEAHFEGADLPRANLQSAILVNASFREADCTEACFRKARLVGADLRLANFTQANLRGSSLIEADLRETDLSNADLRETDLTAAILVNTNIDGALLSGSSVYSINVWDLHGDFAEQKDLVITPQDAAAITVDNIKVAQFIYLILNNIEIRDVINTLTSKSVLILGRFRVPERKAILDALRNKLREYDLLPIVFDFDRPTNKDFTETIKTLAGLSFFVIADVTNPKSTPLELQATIPDYQIPFVPIIQEGEEPFAMLADLQTRPWVLDTLSYSSVDMLLKALKPAIIDPAIQMHNELQLIKAKKPKIKSAKDFIVERGEDEQPSSVS